METMNKVYIVMRKELVPAWMNKLFSKNCEPIGCFKERSAAEEYLELARDANMIGLWEELVVLEDLPSEVASKKAAEYFEYYMEYYIVEKELM